MEKIVKCRKDHICDICLGKISKGEYALFVSERVPKYDISDFQIGIEYYKGWGHIDPDVCDKFINEGQEGKV